ncbi:ATP-binding protein [Ferrovum sp. PN-J185]|jgi:hypothetical protein|uniref:ATP-binding protein n=2 Tax=Ferrovum sp. PN-J185 TaxID=1356306 RepID=UPI000796C72D|nr:ATP-binding protein [Ferrovum sp. PN-J185]KXW55798.1 hypothetical protein FV185_09570 [Ferrovum sp. PN-J185]HQT82217.1 ATP-binding protein [Ferrovaceae bacterium]
MFYARNASKTIERLTKGFPIIAITGPRQSGKTTLARHQFPDKPYISLENPDEREFATNDPKRFLARFPKGAVLDEIQRCPSLFSWLQGIVDQQMIPGQFILTGSSQFELLSSINQSLAGRVGKVELLTLSLSELKAAHCMPATLDQLILKGTYPALYSREIEPTDWYSNYVATYVERDVRQLINVKNLNQFQRFLKLCAARSGQLLNLTSLGNDCGISSHTAQEWISVLEASYIVKRIMPFHSNFGKRLIKAPKLYFLDTGLASWLLNITTSDILSVHPFRGALFESMVVAEMIKHQFNHGSRLHLSFWRDNSGTEIDIIDEQENPIKAVEIKSGATFTTEWVHSLIKLNRLLNNPSVQLKVIYGGDESFERDNYQVTSWRDL